MATPIVGAGFLIAENILEDASFSLYEPFVSTTVPVGGIAAGSQTVNAWDASMYVGAQLVVGNAGATDIEVVTITGTNPGTSFTATFANNHNAGEFIAGATFPREASNGDPLYTQPEMLGYLSSAYNDFLSVCPLAIGISIVTVGPTAQNASLPSDCMVPMRMAYQNYPLRETSQSNLDLMIYNWQQQAATGPYCYFRDKVPLQNFGIFPRANNTSPIECIYQQRGPQTIGLADGFLIPDIFLPYIKFRLLVSAYSKDGEMRQPALARYWNERYKTGVMASNIFLAAVQDPNLEMSPSSGES